MQRWGPKSIEKLVSMAAPAVIGSDYVKEGLLLVAAANCSSDINEM